MVSYQVVLMAAGQALGDEGVVAHADVEEARPLAGQGHRASSAGPGVDLPGLHVDGRLGLDGELDAVDGASRGQHGDDVGGRGEQWVLMGSAVTSGPPRLGRSASASANSSSVPNWLGQHPGPHRSRWAGTSQVKPIPPWTWMEVFPF